MRIVLVTQEEPFYLPTFLLRVIEARKDVVAVVVLPPLNKSIWKVSKMLYDLYGLYDFSKLCLRFLIAKIADYINRIIPIARPYSIAELAKRKRMPLYSPQNINSPDFLRCLRNELKPDILVSIAASQILKKEILSIPTKCCINVHSAPLPRYRGMMPNFWALLNGEKSTAVSVHYIVEELDDGDILIQEPVPIYKDDSLDSLITRSKHIGVEALLKALDQLGKGMVKPIANDRNLATYFSFPTRADAERFRSQGRAFF